MTLYAMVICAIAGFVMSGVIGSFYQLLTAEKPDFMVTKATVGGNVAAVLMSMFAGPIILANKVIGGLGRNEMTVPWALINTAIAWIWSVCAGVFYFSLII